MVDIYSVFFLFRLFLFYIILNLFLEPHISSYVIVLRLLFGYFKFWDVTQNYVPNIWQVVFANVFVQGRVVHSNIYMASLMALAIVCPSLPMILKFFTDVVWPVLLW